MTNVVIASNDPLAQSLQAFLINQQGFVAGPPLDPLGNGNQLWIVAHDSELGDGSAFLRNLLQNTDFPMEVAFEVVLIVCSAASLDFGSELLTPAERIANTLGRNVIASSTDVYGQWGPNGFAFQGNFVTVTPNTDLTSLFDQLTLD
ncbi:hypothetical protein LL974_13635 [Xanthomonas campestris pv. cannae]|nr:hypothetical protein [Xanthomonas campestris pv. cannae]